MDDHWHCTAKYPLSPLGSRVKTESYLLKLRYYNYCTNIPYIPID